MLCTYPVVLYDQTFCKSIQKTINTLNYSIMVNFSFRKNSILALFMRKGRWNLTKNNNQMMLQTKKVNTPSVQQMSPICKVCNIKYIFRFHVYSSDDLVMKLWWQTWEYCVILYYYKYQWNEKRILFVGRREYKLYYSLHPDLGSFLHLRPSPSSYKGSPSRKLDLTYQITKPHYVENPFLSTLKAKESTKHPTS